jgi:hypothetical protein
MIEIVADSAGATLVRDDRCRFMDKYGRDYRPPSNPIPPLFPRELSEKELTFLEESTLILAMRHQR